MADQIIYHDIGLRNKEMDDMVSRIKADDVVAYSLITMNKDDTIVSVEGGDPQEALKALLKVIREVKSEIAKNMEQSGNAPESVVDTLVERVVGDIPSAFDMEESDFVKFLSGAEWSLGGHLPAERDLFRRVYKKGADNRMAKVS